jgi:pSer/pThr/pTyr-binding forkhead associated (FHA) protein
MMRIAYRITLPDGQMFVRDATGESIRLGRETACEIPLSDAYCPMVSGLHARIESSNGDFFLVHESRSNKTLLNEAVIDDRHRIRCGDRVKLGYTGPIIEPLSLESSPADSSREEPQADAGDPALLHATLGAERFEIGRGGVIGSDRDCQFRLDHPRVSRVHAGLASDGEIVAIVDLGSAEGTFVNRRRITRPRRLQIGDGIDIGPLSLRFDGMGLVSLSQSHNADSDQYEGFNLARRLVACLFGRR